MILDDKIVDDVKTAGDKLSRLESETEEARDNYYFSIRRLHIAGGSLREIAEALGLSHQRVHQIVGTGNRSWKQFLRRQIGTKSLSCSFCGRSDKQVQKLLAGPDVHICDDCVTAAAIIEGEAVNEERGDFRRVEPSSQKRCSFCGTSAKSRKLMSANGHQICDQCRTLSDEILSRS